jgi:hypothetical protein
MERKVYDETKELPVKEYIRKIKNDADSILSKRKVELISISSYDRKRVA